MNHDFRVGNIVPSVTLRCNIPKDVSESFFIGGEDGYGQLFVTLRDAVFDPSEVYDHCAQLVVTLRDKGLNPKVLVLQTDGGPDHSLKRMATKFALIATFSELDLDRLVALRGAPNGSASNKVERGMCILNLPLAHTALKRGEMPEYAEKAVKNCNSMAAIRTLVAKMEVDKKEAIETIAKLEKELADDKFAEVAVPIVAQMAAQVKVRAGEMGSKSSTKDIVEIVVSSFTHMT